MHYVLFLILLINICTCKYTNILDEPVFNMHYMEIMKNVWQTNAFTGKPVEGTA